MSISGAWQLADRGLLVSISAIFVVVLFEFPALAQPTAVSPQDESQEFYDNVTRTLARGQNEEAMALALSRPDSDPVAAAVRARVMSLSGEYEQAEELLLQVANTDPTSEAGLELGLLLTYLGRSADAAVYLETIVSSGARSRQARDLYQAGLAAKALGEFRQANAFFRVAAQVSPENAGIQTAWGELFLEKYNRAEAMRSFQDALSIDDEWVPAHLGIARVLASENPPAARQAVERALVIDPDSAEARLVVAELDLDARNRKSARDQIEEVLAINPNNLEARALLAAIDYLEDRTDDFVDDVAFALGINSSYGDVYRVSAARAAGAYRFPEAVNLVRQGLEIEPENTRAYAELGLYLLRTGDEVAARSALERSFANDPFDVMTFNLLSMMDTLEEFETFERDDVILRLHPDEAPVLREAVLGLAQEAIDTLSSRYRMTVQGPILIEIFPKHDDFAVRTLGLPGMIGALGACFGSVVTMDSPRARPPGDFNWKSTLWHEIAHVITLQMSKQRLPRWLSEGISTYEEKVASPAWGRDQAMEFAESMNQNNVLSLRELNSGFQRPDTISLAYFQASILVEHIVEKHGAEVLQGLVRAYGDGLETEQALATVELDFDSLQTSFNEAIEDQFGSLRLALKRREEPVSVPRDGNEDIAVLRERVSQQPGNFWAQFALGRALFYSGEFDDARVAFQFAGALAPMATGFDSPSGFLARIAQAEGDREAAKNHLESLLEYDETSLDAVRLLAALAEETADRERMRHAYERHNEIDPFDPIPHQALGRLAMADGLFAEAIEELEVALALGPVDRVSAYSDFAESLLAIGDLDGAKRQAIAALEIAPTYERAQDLLLKAVETK